MKCVLFCDDSANAFWLDAARNRLPGWKDEDWGGWTIKTIAHPAGGGMFLSRFLSVIQAFLEEKRFGESIYVVTDAHFSWKSGGPLEFGGAKLLEELIEGNQLAKGVVFSRDPALTEALLENGNVCPVINNAQDPEVLARAIRHFFETGVRPEVNPEAAVSLLSRCIHRLDNLVLPMRLDFETLDGSDLEEETLKEIWNDYFGSASAFLMPEHGFSDDTKGIEFECEKLLRSIECLQVVKSSGEIGVFFGGGGLNLGNIKASLGIDTARTEAHTKSANEDWMKDVLLGASDKISQLVQKLREIREGIENS